MFIQSVAIDVDFNACVINLFFYRIHSGYQTLRIDDLEIYGKLILSLQRGRVTIYLALWALWFVSIFFSSPFWSDLLLVISEVMNTIQTHDFVFLWLKILWWLFSFSPRNIFTTREEFYRERQPLIASYLPFSLTRKHREKTQNKAEIKPLIQNEIRFNQLVCLPLVFYKSISLSKAY